MIKMESSNDSCLSIVGMGYERKWVEIFLRKFFPWHYCFFLGICDSQTGGDIWTQFILISYLVVGYVYVWFVVGSHMQGEFYS